jgi:RimJ/RimL family protein N-acetyltransferase
MWGNEAVVKHIGGKTRDAQTVWFQIARNLGMWSLKGYGYLTVEHRKTHEIIGEVGFSDFKRGLDPDISPYPEAGWVIDQPHWGQGYATEALKALHDWLAYTHPDAKPVCIIDEGHTRSINVANKLGYTEWTRTKMNDAAIVILRKQA